MRPGVRSSRSTAGSCCTSAAPSGARTDDAMDAYAQVLEHLRADDFRRLREFAARAAQPRLHLARRRLAPHLRSISIASRYGRPAADGRRASSDARAAGCRISSPNSSSCTSRPIAERDESRRARIRHAELYDALQARAHRPHCARSAAAQAALRRRPRRPGDRAAARLSLRPSTSTAASTRCSPSCGARCAAVGVESAAP